MSDYLRSMGLVFTLIAAFGCRGRNFHSKSQTADPPPPSEEYSWILVKLRSPALLENAELDANAKPIITAEAKDRVLREQAEAIKFLQSLSDEVKIIYRYRFVLNALSIYLPDSVFAKVRSYRFTTAAQKSMTMSRPFTRTHTNGGEANSSSVEHIGVDRVHRELFYTDSRGQRIAIDGSGIKIGIIDTGIDYTHILLGGSGNVDSYKGIDPKGIPTHDFPNAKVVGGIDLVGSHYSRGANDLSPMLPVPDANPIDEDHHGTHVAGIVAGASNDINFQSIAPGAKLYAIKVFGKSGYTSDVVVIAALEYAVDPNGDLDPSDRLDIVNLSLGSPFGLPFGLYNEAVSNLSRAGVVAVVAAGNSGNVSSVVGSPGTSDEAISVAASIDDGDHNWRFRAIRFHLGGTEILHKAIEATFSGSLAELAEGQKTKLVPVGMADQELGPAQKAALAGHVALVDRGSVTFASKMARVREAGASGVVVVNSVAQDPFSMGGTTDGSIPAVMISRALGERIKQEIRRGGDVLVEFNVAETLESPELIDTLAPYTSRGPRPIDALIKPEISAPGERVLSALVGSGDEGLIMSGTSMAAPHITGVAALLRQYRGPLPAQTVKDLLLGTSVALSDEDDRPYSVAHQGAGRVDAYRALTSPIVLSPAALSLGIHELGEDRILRRSIKITNLSNTEINLVAKITAPPRVTVNVAKLPVLPARGSIAVPLTFHIGAPTSSSEELSGAVEFVSSQDADVYGRVSFLAVIKGPSKVGFDHVQVVEGKETSPVLKVDVILSNHGTHAGKAYLFNLLSYDARYRDFSEKYSFDNACALESVGYRLIWRGPSKYIQFAAKLWNPLTSWHHCELSIQLDNDGQGRANQEIVGGALDFLSPNGPDQTLSAVLINTNKMKALRDQYRTSGDNDYSLAISATGEVLPVDLDTLLVVSFPLDSIHKDASKSLRIKVAGILTNDPGGMEDDHLQTIDDNRWLAVNPDLWGSPQFQIPEAITIAPGAKARLSFYQWGQDSQLIGYFPANRSTDEQRRNFQSALATVYRE